MTDYLLIVAAWFLVILSIAFGRAPSDVPYVAGDACGGYSC